MKLFKCTCGWSYIVGKRKVYGPIFGPPTTAIAVRDASCAHMMTRDEFKGGYGDCAIRMNRQTDERHY